MLGTTLAWVTPRSASARQPATENRDGIGVSAAPLASATAIIATPAPWWNEAADA